jgi:hypothetical protein
VNGAAARRAQRKGFDAQGSRPAATMREMRTWDGIMTTMSSNSHAGATPGFGGAGSAQPAAAGVGLRL